jgi:1,4-dihydroxy-2-naphthoate octaprenyltransferase
MAKLNAAVRSMRLRTLPLSLSGVVMGAFIAASKVLFDWKTVVFLFLTTICLQILSNLSNELGDVLSGNDNEDRIGPEYGLNSGEMSIADMKKLIITFIFLCMLFGVLMILCSFGTLLRLESICLMVLGACAIVAAMKYTLGKSPYGYRGLGDIFVFIFFGLVSVMGSYYVMAHTLDASLLLPAASIGFFSIGVLNVNNMRDIETDAPRRVTVAMKLGMRRARIYHFLLISFGWVAMVLYMAFLPQRIWHWLFLLTLPLYIIHLKGVSRLEGKALDKMLPLLVMSTFIFSVLAGAGLII